jgi:hypothetical protein
VNLHLILLENNILSIENHLSLVFLAKNGDFLEILFNNFSFYPRARCSSAKTDKYLANSELYAPPI